MGLRLWLEETHFFAHFAARLCGNQENKNILLESWDYNQIMQWNWSKLCDGQADGEKRSGWRCESNLTQRANVVSAHLWRSPNDGLPVLMDLQHGEEGVCGGVVLLSLSPWGRKSER